MNDIRENGKIGKKDDEHGSFRHGAHEREARTGHDGERSLTSDNELREVECSVLALHIPERVPGGVFRDFRARGGYRAPVLFNKFVYVTINASLKRLEFFLLFKRGARERPHNGS